MGMVALSLFFFCSWRNKARRLKMVDQVVSTGSISGDMFFFP